MLLLRVQALLRCPSHPDLLPSPGLLDSASDAIIQLWCWILNLHREPVAPQVAIMWVVGPLLLTIATLLIVGFLLFAIGIKLRPHKPPLPDSERVAVRSSLRRASTHVFLVPQRVYCARVFPGYRFSTCRRVIFSPVYLVMLAPFLIRFLPEYKP